MEGNGYAPRGIVGERRPQPGRHRDPVPAAGWHPGVPLGDLLEGGTPTVDEGTPVGGGGPTVPTGHGGVHRDPRGALPPETTPPGGNADRWTPEVRDGAVAAWAGGAVGPILASVPSWLRARAGARWVAAGLVGIVAAGWVLLALLQGGGPQVDPAIPLATTPASSVAAPTPHDPPPGLAGAATEAGDSDAGGGPDTPGVVTAHVAGAVARPGVHTLEPGARIADLVAAAGGETPDADLDRVNLAAVVPDGARVWVPRRGEDLPPEVLDPVVGDPVPTAGGGVGGAGTPGPGGGRVSLNRADAAELEALPGIGPATASAIVAHRAQHGPFPTVEALEAVRGIGPAKMEALRDLVEP